MILCEGSGVCAGYVLKIDFLLSHDSAKTVYCYCGDEWECYAGSAERDRPLHGEGSGFNMFPSGQRLEMTSARYIRGETPVKPPPPL